MRDGLGELAEEAGVVGEINFDWRRRRFGRTRGRFGILRLGRGGLLRKVFILSTSIVPNVLERLNGSVEETLVDNALMTFGNDFCR